MQHNISLENVFNFQETDKSPPTKVLTSILTSLIPLTRPEQVHELKWN